MTYEESVSRQMGTTALGSCIAVDHPTLHGRVRVRWTNTADETVERWVPTLLGLVVRVDDQVLLSTPADEALPIVVGVVDGYREKRMDKKEPVAAMSIAKDESVVIQDAEGNPLLEVSQGEGGPVVRLGSHDIEVETPGRLRFSARTIDLCASGGSVDISATDDVVVQGEMIKLN